MAAETLNGLGDYAGDVVAAPAPVPSMVLPKNLDRILSQLADEDLRLLRHRLFSELKRRRQCARRTEPSGVRRIDGTKLPVIAEVTDVPQPRTVSASKRNLILTSFKAGMSPGQIARTFHISTLLVRQVLAEDGLC